MNKEKVSNLLVKRGFSSEEISNIFTGSEHWSREDWGKLTTILSVEDPAELKKIQAYAQKEAKKHMKALKATDLKLKRLITQN